MSSSRITIALVTFAVWVAITVLGARVLQGGEADLGDLVSHGFAWQIIAAAAFVLAVTLWKGWANETGLRSVRDLRDLRLAWLPVLYILAGLGAAVAAGLPPASVVMWVLINTLFVGFSEELMFRGVLLQAFRSRYSIWPAVIITSLMFGAVHSLNIFTTGQVMQSLVQSVAAALSGLIFMALRLRTGSIWPGMLLHGLWDFSTFTFGAAAGAAGDPATAGGPALAAVLVPVILVLPNAIYALYLLRNIARDNADPAT